MSQPAHVLVTPIWNPVLERDEVARLRLSARNVPEGARFVVCPEGVDMGPVVSELPGWEVRAFPAPHFASHRAYSAWLVTDSLYAAFQDFDFIIVCQTDAVILRNLPTWVWGFDYTGAPWNPPWRVHVTHGEMRIFRIGPWSLGRKLDVGNGGLSIRRTRSFREASHTLGEIAPPTVLANANEDAVWAYYKHDVGLSFCPAELAGSAFLDIRDDLDVDPAEWVGIHGLKESAPRASRAVRDFLRFGSG